METCAYRSLLCTSTVRCDINRLDNVLPCLIDTLLDAPKRKHVGRFHFSDYKVNSRDISRKRQPIKNLIGRFATHTDVQGTEHVCSARVVDLSSFLLSNSGCAFVHVNDSCTHCVRDDTNEVVVRV